MSYDVLIGYWNGACYETVERSTLDADTEDEAIEEAKALADNFDDDEDYDMQIVVEDDDGNHVWSETFKNSVSVNRENDMTLLAESEGEFCTVRIMTDGEKFYRIDRNGGSKGAHDRTDGSGRWIESYPDPEELTPAEAIDWLVEGDSDFSGMYTTDAVELIVEKSDWAKDDLIREAGKEIGRVDSLEGLYRIRSKYFLTWPDAKAISGAEAEEWLSDHEIEADLEG